MTTVPTTETHVLYGSLDELVQVATGPDLLALASIYHNLFMVYQSVTPGTGQLSGKNVFQIQMVMEEQRFHQNSSRVSLKHKILGEKGFNFQLGFKVKVAFEPK